MKIINKSNDWQPIVAAHNRSAVQSSETHAQNQTIN